MNPNLKDAIEYIKKMGSKIEMGMFTNGSMLERFDLPTPSCKLFNPDKSFIGLRNS